MSTPHEPGNPLTHSLYARIITLAKAIYTPPCYDYDEFRCFAVIPYPETRSICMCLVHYEYREKKTWDWRCEVRGIGKTEQLAMEHLKDMLTRRFEEMVEEKEEEGDEDYEESEESSENDSEGEGEDDGEGEGEDEDEDEEME